MTPKLSYLLVALVSVALLVGADSDLNSYHKVYSVERPVVNLPLSMRQENWLSGGSGSCVWATTISLLRWQGEYELAEEVRQSRGGGVWLGELFAELDAIGITYAGVCNSEEWFLEWACETRRGAAIPIMGGRHMVALVEITETEACILDNNSVEKYLWLPRNVLISDWKNSGGYAFTPIYTPQAPLP